MVALVPLEPLDYLVIGHVTQDKTPTGSRLGGTASFAALTARAFGLKVGIVTSVSPGTSLAALSGIPLVNVASPQSTSFENIRTPAGRTQIVQHQAAPIPLESVPEPWRRSAIIHLGPVAQELPAEIAKGLSATVLGMTPQGWMRKWDAAGHVSACKWDAAEALLPLAGAVVISREDVGGDDDVIEAMAHHTRVLAVTENAGGAVLYWNGDRRRFRSREVSLVDDVGAGDIFAAAFFIRLYMTRDPWEAARLATALAAQSVTREGFASIPTPQEIEANSMEVLR